MVAISLVAGLAMAALSVPAAAQQDDRFYGRWEPSSTPAAGSILYIDPGGYLSSLRLNGEFTNERYEVIRDFGDRLVVRMWPLGNEPWELIARETDMLVVLEITRDSGITLDSKLVVPPTDREFMSYHFCNSPAAHEDFFQDDDPDNVWRRIQEWSVRLDEGPPFDHCGLGPQGAFLASGFWSTMSWARDINSDRQ